MLSLSGRGVLISRVLIKMQNINPLNQFKLFQYYNYIKLFELQYYKILGKKNKRHLI